MDESHEASAFNYIENAEGYLEDPSALSQGVPYALTAVALFLSGIREELGGIRDELVRLNGGTES